MITTDNSSAYQHINLDYLDMMSDGDNDMKKVMIEMLFDELPQEIEKMKSLYQQQSWDELSAVSHKMKSTLSFVGNDAMTNANKVIEIAAKEKTDTDQINGLLATLSEQFPKAISELKVEFDKL